MEVASSLAAPFTGGASLLAAPLLKNLGQSPSIPKSPDPISAQTPAVQQAASEAAARRSRGRGYAATILSQLTASTGSTAPRDTIGS